MKGLKTVYICSECGCVSPKWLGKCNQCGAWNSFVEDVISTAPEKPQEIKHRTLTVGKENLAMRFSETELPDYIRSNTRLSELDRVLGGGLVHGSVVLLSGEPGIGKSTLLMQISDALGEDKKVLYISGEESSGQLKLRAKRLGIVGNNLFILTETELEKTLAQIEKVRPDVIIVDSIQTMYSDKISSAPGTITQIKECTLAFIARAKSEGISVILEIGRASCRERV